MDIIHKTKIVQAGSISKLQEMINAELDSLNTPRYANFACTDLKVVTDTNVGITVYTAVLIITNTSKQ